MRDCIHVAERLGLHRRSRRYGPCPACGADRTADRRPPLRITASGWWCNACQNHGDAVDLACWARLQREVRKGDADLRTVFEWLDGTACEPRQEVAQPDPPPIAELLELLRSCRPVVEDPEAAAYLRGRGINPALAPAGAIPHGFSARWWPKAWSSTWRIVVPAFNGRGELRTLHARAIGEAKPKTRWPLDCDARGVVFADRRGRALLRADGLRIAASAGTVLEVDRLIVTEGLTDFLWTSGAARGTAAVISVESGSETALGLVRIPESVRVYVATHADATGDQYAQAVADAFAPHPCFRVPLHLLARIAA